jgi:hypothetical protein
MDRVAQARLETGTGNLPERTRDTVGPGNVRGLEEGSGPSPLTDNHTGGKTSLDHTPGSAEVKRKDRKKIPMCELSESLTQL